MKPIVYALLLAALALDVSARQTERRYLTGHGPEDAVSWDFKVSDGMKAGKWSKIDVPSNWEQEGFGGYTYGRYYIYDRPSDKKYADYREHEFHDESGIYRRSFDVPASWRGMQVSIVFDGVMTDADVYVNGRQAGPVHQGGFYRFSHDITDKLKYGKKNSIEVRVAKQSADKSVNAAERRADWWLFGGIYRPVWLEARPMTQIRHVAVDARADGTLDAVVDFMNLADGQTLEVTVASAGSRTVLGTRSVKLSKANRQKISTRWDGVRIWDPEHPNLYDVTMRLVSADGKIGHEVSERIGFRTVEFRPGDGLYLNGTKLLVKGTNRHSFDPRTGRAVSREMSLKDAKLIKKMNMNAVRQHYPAEEAFLEICDSIGLLYLDEFAGWQNSYSDETAKRLLPEFIVRDVNHPCVFIWSNGNEGGWNTAVDKDFAVLDPQRRHVVHPWSSFDGLDTRHYPHGDMPGMYRMENSCEVFMMTEFLHGLYDRGQGAGLDGLWSLYRQNPLFAGGFLWAYLDEALIRTDTGKYDTYGPNAPDGIVSAEREPEGSFWTVREVWSPVQIAPFRITPSFRGGITVTNDFLFSNLDRAELHWRLIKTNPVETTGQGTCALPAAMPGESRRVSLQLPADFLRADVLELTAVDRPTGDTICNWSYPVKDASTYFAENRPQGNAEPAVTGKTGDDVTLSANGVSARFGLNDGRLLEVRDGDTVVPFTDGPLPEGIKMKFESSRTYMQGDTAVFAVHYTGACDSIVWRMTPDGLLGMDAMILNWRRDNRFEGEMYDKPVRNLGFSFSFPENEVRGMSWVGNGPYRVWKNRVKGTSFGLWQKDYNNTVTGEYYNPVVYPEFKGYHANMYRADIQSERYPFTVYSETDGLYLRVFTPEEQRDREGRGKSVAHYPHGDISFLLEIPKVSSQGIGGDPSFVRINKGDAGNRIRLWFDFRNTANNQNK